MIVSTYQRPQALNAVLRGLANQADRNFEILVADDGSDSSTADVVASWTARVGMRLSHVWQRDRGFRLAEVRNRAILRSAGSYCVFLDGDSLPRPSFIAAHRRLAEIGWFVAGNRVLLSEVATARLLARKDAVHFGWTTEWLRARWRGDVNRVLPLLSVPLGPLRRLHAKQWRGARGANLGVFRDDLFEIDGFDASYSGWGFEDSDLIIRLIRAGRRRKDGHFATAVIHLWHPENDRSYLSQNLRRLADIEQSDRTRALQGLSSLAQVGDPVGCA